MPRIIDIIAAIVNRIEPLRLMAVKAGISEYAEACPPRPYSHSMHANYVTWTGLVERKFSGRHLPPATGAKAPAEPDLDRLAALFERDEFIPSHDTSLMFPIFAQWFVDGFLRTKWEDPNEPRKFRENESNQEIDLNQLYGSSETQTLMLRDLGNGGRLKSRIVDGEEWPVLLFEEREDGIHLRDEFAKTDDRPGLYTDDNLHRIFSRWTDEQLKTAWATGLEFGSATLGQSAMNALFLREHNRVAGVIAKAHPDWEDDQVFETTRNVMIVLLLNIVLGDYIPHIATKRLNLAVPPGWAEEQPWYRTNRMAVEFALLYRWHDLIPDEFDSGDGVKPATALTRPNGWLEGVGLGDALLGATRTRAGRIGLFNTASFLNMKGGADVKRLSIEMGRSTHLASYNEYRKLYSLKPIKSFFELTKDKQSAAELQDLYGSIDKLEWFVGIFAEHYEKPQMMGDLLRIMVAHDAFTQAFTNPLLAKSVFGPATFSEEGLNVIKQTQTLADLITRNTTAKDKRKLTMRHQG
ncbi:MAG: hypothetical protein HRU11_08025 [Parvularculaceae bacterium]|nr:hypothetical protein [Parvularculaceae bacterium]